MALICFVSNLFCSIIARLLYVINPLWTCNVQLYVSVLQPFNFPAVCRVWPGGGTLPLEGGTGMCHSHDLLFSGQSALPSLPINHQFAAHASPILNFKKDFAFSALFLWPKLQLSRCNISKFLLPRETRSLDPTPTFENLCVTYPPKKVECPPPPGVWHFVILSHELHFQRKKIKQIGC